MHHYTILIFYAYESLAFLWELYAVNGAYPKGWHLNLNALVNLGAL